MGQRGRTETIAQVIFELMRRRTVSQAELARALEVSARTIRQCVLDLQGAGMPIDREEEHPHVWYSVPHKWIPSGAVVAEAEIGEILRILARMPSTETRRNAIAARLGKEDPWSRVSLALEDSLEPRELKVLEALEDSALHRYAARISYLSIVRGTVELRHVSCQRIAYHERPTRFLAVCHRSGKLKWFLLARVMQAEVDEAETFRAASSEEIDDVVDNILLDFQEAREPIECVFVVHAPAHRWFVPRLGKRAEVEPVGESVRVRLRTGALRVLARELVGLADAVSVESVELREEVRRVATAALESLRNDQG